MECRTRSRTGITWLAIVICLSAHADTTWDPAGYWTGELTYRGADLEVHVHIQQKDAVVSGYLDIPALVYANQPLAVSLDDELMTLEFPFGLGEFAVEATGVDQLAGQREDFSLRLARSELPGHSRQELRFGATTTKLNGTLFLPEGDGPHSVVVQVAGSGNATRENWSYASWAEFYLQQGVGSFIYDRKSDSERLPDGSIAGIEHHAADVADVIRQLGHNSRVDADRIGVAGSSRGAWIAMAAAYEVPDVAFLILSSPAAATPGEQEMTSVLTGMRQDGLDATDLAEARAYLRLYFYVAQTGLGWDVLSEAMAAGADSNWLQYVDQPRSAKDLEWWRSNMNFDAVEYLQQIKVPVLALWGGDDFITPWADYRLKLESALQAAGNTNVTTRVFDGADHRLEVGFGENEAGEWHWFGLAPGALDTIGQFVQ
jgi:pimeloyl-ACP methyl ester carboxylesterase